ncbi:hypothetical protein HAX54_040333, partial [Datura stramonium]|nr:hypothetical protein [Datura stramonium]
RGPVDRFRMYESSFTATCCMSSKGRGMSARMSGQASKKRRSKAVYREETFHGTLLGALGSVARRFTSAIGGVSRR